MTNSIVFDNGTNLYGVQASPLTDSGDLVTDITDTNITDIKVAGDKLLIATRGYYSPSKLYVYSLPELTLVDTVTRGESEPTGYFSDMVVIGTKVYLAVWHASDVTIGVYDLTTEAYSETTVTSSNKTCIGIATDNAHLYCWTKFNSGDSWNNTPSMLRLDAVTLAYETGFPTNPIYATWNLGPFVHVGNMMMVATVYDGSGNPGSAMLWRYLTDANSWDSTLTLANVPSGQDSMAFDGTYVYIAETEASGYPDGRISKIDPVTMTVSDSIVTTDTEDCPVIVLNSGTLHAVLYNNTSNTARLASISTTTMEQTGTVAIEDVYPSSIALATIELVSGNIVFDDVVLSEVRAATPPPRAIAFSASGNNDNVVINATDFTAVNSLTVPDEDVERYYIEVLASVVAVTGHPVPTDDNDFVFARLVATKFDNPTYNFPADPPSIYNCPARGWARNDHLDHCNTYFFSMPTNLRGYTVTLQMMIQYQTAREFGVQTYMVGWGHKQHVHDDEGQT